MIISRISSLSRSVALRNASLSISRPVARSTLLASRSVASSVSSRPASQTMEQAALNIKEEVGNSAADLAKVIASANMTSDRVAPQKETFLGITNAVASSVPKPYLVFGLAGALPYVGTAAATVWTAKQAGLAATGVVTNIDPGVAITILDQALNLQVTYGAVMLSFLGALHWGMEFAGYGGHKGYSRLVLGAAPILFAWPTLALQPVTALIVQWAGFTSLWWADSKATQMGWAPKWYSQYRFYLSILVGTCIIGSLAGTSFYGPVGGHGLVSHDLDLLREQRKQARPEGAGVVHGDIEALPAGENDDHYVNIRKKAKDNEGKKN
ncbi:hypothetical protein EYR36_001065 [Pleurotus pulmonarius]|nr:hypothetical protein EYR36_004312 [Pleurotus pulmonarius]KAF4579255.1 hypothetical protein EYR36_001065 [Pleurotus pulmonarius]KAF4603405.1 hypothetical protein EYR38_003818 [Pleurotus pulmonarius]